MNPKHGKSSSESLLLFTWGYWGWGSTTKQFVESVDVVEKSRGFEPPVFVDVRFRRSVRAAGFREAAFQQVTGPDRYVWMNGLGNKGVGTGDPALKDPNAVMDLLKLAEENLRHRRRVIYFCACQIPAECHRSFLVTETLPQRTQKQRRDIGVVEWPGTDLPESPLRWEVAPKELTAVERGRKTFEMPSNITLGEAAGLAWYTPIRLVAGDSELPILAGPAMVQKDRWVIQALDTLERGSRDRDMRRQAVSRRAAGGYEFHGKAQPLNFA